MSELYDADILAWSERQAQLLRQLADGKPGNEPPDWENIIEEVESVGRSELNAVASLLVQALRHEMKAAAWPDSREVPHWRAEARSFRGDAAAIYTPSMRQRIDMKKIRARALDGLPESIDGVLPLPLPQDLPESDDVMFWLDLSP